MVARVTGVSFDYGVLTMILVMGTGSMAALFGSPLLGMAAIASATSMPEITCP
jgi:hypothetical protein